MKDAGITGKRSLIKNFILRNELFKHEHENECYHEDGGLNSDKHVHKCHD